MDYQDLLDKIRDLYDWEYEEMEGISTRFDFTSGGEPASLWVHENGTLEGHAPRSTRSKLEIHNLNETIKFI